MIITKKTTVFLLGFVLAIGANQVRSKDVRRIDQEIDWVLAETAKQEDNIRDANGIRSFRSAKVPSDILNRTKIPVLVFGTGPVRAAPNVYTQGEAYASTYKSDGSSITILGSRSAILMDDNSELSKNLDKDQNMPYSIDYFEDGIDLNFSRFGAAYTLRITCSRTTDVRCTDKKYIVDAYKSLVTVGGSKK